MVNVAEKVGNDEYGEIFIYQTDDGDTNKEVKRQNETVWLTQQQLMQLYRCSKSNISEHYNGLTNYDTDGDIS